MPGVSHGWPGLGTGQLWRSNPNPWLAPEAELAIAAALAGRGYVELIGQIVETALARYAA